MFVSPSLIYRLTELGTVHKSALQGSGAGASTFFCSKVQEGCVPLCSPSVLWAWVFPLVSSPRAWPVQSYSAPSSSLLAVAFSLLGLRGIPACSGLRGSGCSHHYLARLTHMQSTSVKRCDKPFIHLCFACLLLSKFQNSECFQN